MKWSPRLLFLSSGSIPRHYINADCIPYECIFSLRKYASFLSPTLKHAPKVHPGCSEYISSRFTTGCLCMAVPKGDGDKGNWSWMIWGDVVSTIQGRQLAWSHLPPTSEIQLLTPDADKRQGYQVSPENDLNLMQIVPFCVGSQPPPTHLLRGLRRIVLSSLWSPASSGNNPCQWGQRRHSLLLGCPTCHAVGLRWENVEYLKLHICSSAPLGTDLFCSREHCKLQAPLTWDFSWAVGSEIAMVRGTRWHQGHPGMKTAKHCILNRCKVRSCAFSIEKEDICSDYHNYICFLWKQTNSRLEKHNQESKNHSKSEHCILGKTLSEIFLHMYICVYTCHLTNCLLSKI